MFLTIFATLFLAVTLQISSCQEELVDYDAIFINDNPRKGLYFTDMVVYDGYRVEVHYVLTKDNYELCLFRILANANCLTVHPNPVLLMHGLYLSSDSWIVPGPGKAHAYILADLCYDVWIGNNRGNKHSRNHTTLNPDTESDFWKFTFDTMARYDMPALIDYILLKTGQSQIFYIGHSQGTTVFILMCSFYPAYNAKVLRAIGLSTAGFLDHTRLLSLEAQAVISYGGTKPFYGEIFPHGGIVQTLAEILCATSDVSYPLCTVLMFALFGNGGNVISQDTIAVAVHAEPSGSSFSNFERWGQIRRCGFCEEDLGLIGNLAKYGSAEPPLFDLSGFTVETHFITSYEDYVCHPIDLDSLLALMFNCNKCTKCLLSQLYSHIDHIYCDSIGEVLGPIIHEFFQNGVATCS